MCIFVWKQNQAWPLIFQEACQKCAYVVPVYEIKSTIGKIFKILPWIYIQKYYLCIWGWKGDVLHLPFRRFTNWRHDYIFSFSKSRTRQHAVDKGGVALTGGKILCEEVPSDSEFDISHFERYWLLITPQKWPAWKN